MRSAYDFLAFSRRPFSYLVGNWHTLKGCLRVASNGRPEPPERAPRGPRPPTPQPQTHRPHPTLGAYPANQQEARQYPPTNPWSSYSPPASMRSVKAYTSASTKSSCSLLTGKLVICSSSSPKRPTWCTRPCS